jgi:ABC-type Mn2+/Zn2+ transport system permease subunit
VTQVAAAIDLVTEPLSQPVVQRALLELVVIGIGAGVLGCWVVLYEASYAAESVSHSLLPGLVAASLIGVPLLIGGAVAAVVAAVAIAAVSAVEGISRDTAVAVVVTAMLGLGALLALSPDSPRGIGELLFGDPLAISGSDLVVTGALVAGVLIAARLAHTRFLIVGFDLAGARDLGISRRAVELCLLSLVAIAVLAAVQSLGNLLVVAIFVGPAAIAHQLVERLLPMMLVAVSVAAGAALVGLYLSYWLEIAAGAAVAGTIALAYVLAAVAGPARG